MVNLPDNIAGRLQISAVFLIIVVGVSLAFWLNSRADHDPLQYELLLPAWTLAFDEIKIPKEPATIFHGSLSTVAPRDPFIPFNVISQELNAAREEAKELELKELALALTVVSSRQRLSLINNIMMREGEQGAGFVLTRIMENGVVVKIDGQEFHLAVGERINIDSRVP